MLSPDFVILTAVGYVGLLFLLAYLSDARAQGGNAGFLRSPVIYTLSISVYCTSWTFYGAVGTAARSGLEFMAIYMGPTLVFVGWWFLLRKMIRIAHTQHITSIADFLSSRFGMSSRLAVLVTLIAVVSITPYIALQLKAITTSIQTISVAKGDGDDHLAMLDEVTLALAVAIGMAVFTILFGTRNVDAREQHPGVVAAIAFEAVVKLLALVAVGLFVVFGVSDGISDIYARAADAGLRIHETQPFGSRWIAVLILSACAVICLPRQFQITVVENADEDHLRTAGWAFPAYMLVMSLFTMPIALYGLSTMPAGSNPDMFVLTLPMITGHDALALFAFIGGFSSATSMIIVASIALSIMVSNHIVVPLALRASAREETGERDIARLLLRSRRISIAGMLLLGFLYFWLTQDSDALAPIGLISFGGVAQLLPAMLAAIYWRTATMKGALCSIIVGFVVWAWTLLLPSFRSFSPAVAELVAHGPWGIGALRPEALFGMSGMDPLVHSVFWSLLANAATLLCVSAATRQNALERIQAPLFVDVFRRPGPSRPRIIGGSASTSELFFVAERVLGWARARTLFDSEGVPHRQTAPQQTVSADFMARLERELAGSIGSASAHILLTKAVAGDTISLEEMMQIADETQQAIEYSHALEAKSQELHSTARQLKEANALLQDLHRQKDDFLSQVSHELRTPMTSLRSFAEILMAPEDLTEAQKRRFTATIHRESVRLTKLLDEILDLSALEHGERGWENVPVDAEDVLEQAIAVCEALAEKRLVAIRSGPRIGRCIVLADAGRLAQVFINLIANAISHNDADEPVVHVASWREGADYVVEVSDNGPGISPHYHATIFDKFVRADPDRGTDSQGLGLGLNISHKIVGKLSGRLELGQGVLPGACFRVTLPVWKGAIAHPAGAAV